MPESYQPARDKAMEHILANGIPTSILELGVGSGWYGMALKEGRPGVTMYGVEIWGPYISERHKRYYDKIYIEDLRNFDFGSVPVGMVLAADVMEHLTKEECVTVVNRIKANCPWFVMVIPTCEFIQGPDNSYGNPYEEHKHQWKVDEVVTDLGMAYIADANGICGVFDWKRG
jgi:predicted TPR repeat methyltransferase